MFDYRPELEREALKEATLYLRWALDLIEKSGALKGQDPLHEMSYGRARRTLRELDKLMNE